MNKWVGFVHGFGLPSRLLHIRYWGRIPSRIEAMGLRTVEFETSAYGDVYHNARLLTEQLVQHFNKVDTGSISLICHSRGAIEACIAAMDSRLKDKIESIYGFAAPLFGSYLSTPILNLFRHRHHPLICCLTVLDVLWATATQIHLTVLTNWGKLGLSSSTSCTLSLGLASY